MAYTLKNRPSHGNRSTYQSISSIQDVELKISNLRKNLKIAAAKCRDEIRNEKPGRQTTYRGARARLNLWKHYHSPQKEKKFATGERNMSQAFNVLTVLSELRRTARASELDSVCADSPRDYRYALSINSLSSGTPSQRTRVPPLS